MQVCVQPHKYRHQLRVFIEDTDAGGVVYHANYLKYFERARSEWLRSLGLTQQQFLIEGVQFVVSRCEVDYIQPARLDDELQASVAILKRGRASIVFQQQLWCDDLLLSQANIKVACVNPTTLKPVALPSGLRQQ